MIYLFGDLHGVYNIDKRYNSENFPEGNSLTKNDYVIILGDFGIPWFSKDSDEYKYEISKLRELSNKNWTTLFIDGNHENFDNLNSFPTEEKFGSVVSKIEDSIYWLRRGKIYNIENKKFFTFGGAASIDRGNRTEGYSWWREEVPSIKEMEEGIDNLEKENYEVDYVLTHTIPDSIIDKMIKFYGLNRYDINDTTSKFLEEIYKRIKCKKWFFGHWHFDFATRDYDSPYTSKTEYYGFMYKYATLNTETDTITIS